MKNVTYINASAGSGKTYTLTHLKLAKLIEDEKVKPEQVIMTTFTVKAANEMKEETKKVLYEKGLFNAAEKIDQALIGTIHSVADALIKKYWFFLGLTPDMGVMAEEDKDFFISQSLSELPTDGELRLLHEFCETFNIIYDFNSGKYGLNYDFWKDDIAKVIAYTSNYELDNYEKSKQASIDFIRQFVDPTYKLTFTSEELNAVLDEMDVSIENNNRLRDKEAAHALVKNVRRGMYRISLKWYKEDLMGLLKKWKNIGELASEMLEHLSNLWSSKEVYELEERYIDTLFSLAERWKERFSSYKKERNLLDFNDMEKYLMDILNNKELSKEVAQGYRYLFVDEYQDCSPIQVKIFDRLSELMEHSYWVGDYKQAIYGFRGSDTTLTKAVVDRVATKQNGCNIEPLKISHRSLPDIVGVCNEVFKRTFKGVLDEESVVLERKRTNDGGINSLRYWWVDEKDGPTIADHVANMVKQGIQPNDIAVLGRSNSSLDAIANTLNQKYGIPASRENVKLEEMLATPLILALLALVDSDKDTLAKAQIAFLTVNRYGTQKLINDKLLFDADERNKQKDFLNDVPMVKRLLELRPMLLQQSIGSMIETMIIELDLYNAVKMLGYDVVDFSDKKKKENEEVPVIDRVAESTSCLNTFIRTGYMYEQHCMQMNIPATISGLKDYITIMKPTGTGDVYGVQLHTYHNSKGLQWKYVVMTELDDAKDDAARIVKRNIFGIHFCYTEQPSVDNPYPEVYIRVAPFIYGAGNSKTPEDIQDQIMETELFDSARKEYLSEENRLLYVGMTRPRDVLILAMLSNLGTKRSPLQWFKDVRLDCINPDAEEDILGVGYKFENATLKGSESAVLERYFYMTDRKKMNERRIPYIKDLCDVEQKFVSPSSIKEKWCVVYDRNLCERMPLGPSTGIEMDVAGNCIHQIFCGIEQHVDDESYITSLIKNYGMDKYLIKPAAIKEAWDALVQYLTEQYGLAKKVYHERPFTLASDGRIYTGSIDLVWQTDEGNVVIDFKSNPMGDEALLNEESDFYAGKYGGQLKTYGMALETAGETVLARYIYYPISGMICEIDDPAWYPNTTEEAFAILDKMLSEEEKKEALKVKDDREWAIYQHFGLGLWVRNMWIYKSNVPDYVLTGEEPVAINEGEEISIDKLLTPDIPDNISTDFLTLYHRHLRELKEKV